MLKIFNIFSTYKVKNIFFLLLQGTSIVYTIPRTPCHWTTTRKIEFRDEIFHLSSLIISSFLSKNHF